MSFRDGQIRYFFDLLFRNSLFISARRMFYSSVVQLVHDGWKLIKYTVGHATSYVLYCTFGYKGVLVRALNLHRDQKSLSRTGERWKIS